MCTGMDADYWEPYWRVKYGTKPMPGFIQDAVVKELGKLLSNSSRKEIHDALRKLGLGNLIIESNGAGV